VTGFIPREGQVDMAIKRILVPLDGSESSEKIGGWVAGVAVPLGAEVTLVTVIDPTHFFLPASDAEHTHLISARPGRAGRAGQSGARAGTGRTGTAAGEGTGSSRDDEARYLPPTETQLLEKMLHQAEEYLDLEVDRLNASGVKCSRTVLRGDIAQSIVQHAEEIKADLIAMATHRGSAIARGVLGSITDRVLRSSHIPVMSVHPETLTAFSGSTGQPEVIVVPLDGSERAASVVGLAQEIAKACDAEVVFFRAVQYPYYGVTAVDAAYYQTDYGISYQRREAREYLEEFVYEATQQGLKARPLVTVGAPAARLLEEVKALPRPLIVMSTRGATGLKRWALGSVTDKVVRSSGLPVLVVPPKNE
jgi:nucleotide-binding universal stress UspA family protein